MMRHVVAVVALLALACVAAPAHADVSFLVVGDWGADVKQKADVKTQNAVAAAMARVAKSAHPPISFILGMGDNVYDTGISTPTDPLWKQTVVTPYEIDGLKGIKWISALGNHDYQGVVDYQLSTCPARKADSPNWYMPSRYYQWAVPGVSAEIFVLDTNPWIKDYIKTPENKQMGKEIASQNVPAQQAWFKSAYTASKAQWKLVVGHHGAYTSKDAHSYEEVSDVIQPLMEAAQAAGTGTAYFSGHYHTQEHNVKKNLNFFTTGAGCRLEDDVPNKQAKKPYKDAPNRTEWGMRAPGFMQCTITATAMECNFLDINGKNMHQSTQTLGKAGAPGAPAAVTAAVANKAGAKVVAAAKAAKPALAVPAKHLAPAPVAKPAKAAGKHKLFRMSARAAILDMANESNGRDLE